jgi:hypothetical protein
MKLSKLGRFGYQKSGQIGITISYVQQQTQEPIRTTVSQTPLCWLTETKYPQSMIITYSNVFSVYVFRPGNNGAIWQSNCQKGFQFAERNRRQKERLKKVYPRVSAREFLPDSFCHSSCQRVSAREFLPQSFCQKVFSSFCQSFWKRFHQRVSARKFWKVYFSFIWRVSAREFLPESFCQVSAREFLPESSCQRVSAREFLPENFCQRVSAREFFPVSARDFLPDFPLVFAWVLPCFFPKSFCQRISTWELLEFLLERFCQKVPSRTFLPESFCQKVSSKLLP